MITGVQIRAARGIMRWSTAELAQRASIARSTVIRAEGYDEVPVITKANLTAIQIALEAVGIRFGEDHAVCYHPNATTET